MSWYDMQAATLVPRYGAVRPEALHAWWRNLLRKAPSAVLDLGAGSGRDAAWLAGLGHAVMAAEPSTAMRQQGQRLIPIRGSAGPTTPYWSCPACCAAALASTRCC
jgi:protein-L-isoaspartate O-methyltransferase